MTEPQAGAVQAPAEVAPQPLPTMMHVYIDEPRGMVGLLILDASGQRYVFLHPDDAERLQPVLEQAARAARTGLVIASSQDMPSTPPTPLRSA